MSYLPNNDLAYDDWIAIGLAIKGALGDAGLAIWEDWSAQSAKNDPVLTASPGTASSPHSIGAGTLYERALEAGWEPPSTLHFNPGKARRAAEHEAETPPLPHYPNRGLTVAEAAARLKEEVAAAFAKADRYRTECRRLEDLKHRLKKNDNELTEEEREEAALADIPEPPVTAIRAAAGLGKTEAILRALVEHPEIKDMHVEIYVPNHKLAQELRQRIEKLVAELKPVPPSFIDLNVPVPRALVIQGRGKDGDKNRKPLCKKAKIAEDVAKTGLPVYKSLCYMGAGEDAEKCEFFGPCDYLWQFRDHKPAIQIFPHSNMFTQRRPGSLPRPGPDHCRQVVLEWQPERCRVGARPSGRNWTLGRYAERR